MRSLIAAQKSSDMGCTGTEGSGRPELGDVSDLTANISRRQRTGSFT
jgi:hypothetical protein